jgi:hypothetical protein
MKRYSVCVICLILFSSSQLAGCGTAVPDIQEFWGSPQNAADMEARVEAKIVCELGQAVKGIAGDKSSTKDEYAFLRDWNAEVQLLLAVDEQSSINPTPSYNLPMSSAITHFSGGSSVTTGRSFSLGVSGTYSNEAIRTDKFFVTYKVKDLLNEADWDCNPTQTSGVLFVESDLKIYEWLSGAVNIAGSLGPQSRRVAHASFAAKPDAISHDIKFEIVSSGSVTPTWKLVEFGMGSSPFVSGKRDRTQELVLTMGPPDKAHPDQLGPTAQLSSLSSQITSGINTALRGLNQ